MTRYRYCEHCCKRVPSEGNHTCRPAMTPSEKPSSAEMPERLYVDCENCEENLRRGAQGVIARFHYRPGRFAKGRDTFVYILEGRQAAQVAEAVGKLEEASKRICLEADTLRGQGVGTSNLLRISVMLDDCAALLKEGTK